MTQKNNKAWLVVVVASVLCLVIIAPVVIGLMKLGILWPVAGGIAVLLGFVILLKKTGNDKTLAAKIIEKAKREGTIVEARQVGKVRSYLRNHNAKPPYVSSDVGYTAKYEYVVNGRTYTRAYSFMQSPPSEIKLYYDANKPEKAVRTELDKLGVKYAVLVYLVPVVILVVAWVWYEVASGDLANLIRK